MVESRQVLLFIFIMLTFAAFTLEKTYSQNLSLPNDMNPASVTNMTVPLNTDGLQIVIRNDTIGKSDNEQVSDLYIPLVTAGAAIGGGVIGSLLTYRHNRKIEEQKNKNAIRLENQRIIAGYKKEEFNSRIREIVLLELKYYSKLLDDLIHTTVISTHKAGWEVVLKRPSQYTAMSLEKRVSVFHPYVLTKVEGAFHWFTIFTHRFLIEVDKHLNNEITLERLREILL